MAADQKEQKDSGDKDIFERLEDTATKAVDETVERVTEEVGGWIDAAKESLTGGSDKSDKSDSK